MICQARLPNQDGPGQPAGYNQGLGPHLMSSCPKLVHASREIGGSSPPLWTQSSFTGRRGHRREGSCNLRLSCLRRFETHSAKASATHQGAPAEAKAGTPGPHAERALQGPAGSHLGSPAKVTTPVIGERQASWEPCPTLLPLPSPPLPFTRQTGWAPSLGGELPEVRGTQAWEEGGTRSG